MSGPFTGVVLVGGASTRMGTDKVALFASRVDAVLWSAGATEVVHIGRDDMPDDTSDLGPIGGIATALRVAQHDPVVVLACDLARVHPDGICMVVDALRHHPAAQVAMPAGEPLHAAWRRSALPTVLAAIEAGRLAVRAALDDLDVVEVTGLDSAWLLNVNTPTDLVQTAVVSDASLPHIDVDELARVHAEGAHVIDVRQLDEYLGGHVPGALHIPLDQLGARWEELPTGAELLVICQSGGRSAAAVRALIEAGMTAVNVAGGTKAWIDAGNPVVTGSSPR